MFLLFGETRFRESWRELIIILFPSLFGLSKSHNYQFHWFEQYVFRFLPDSLDFVIFNGVGWGHCTNFMEEVRWGCGAMSLHGRQVVEPGALLWPSNRLTRKAPQTVPITILAKRLQILQKPKNRKRNV